VSEYGGNIDLIGYQNSQAGHLIPGQNTYVFGMHEEFENLYTGKEQWFEPNLPKFAKAMYDLYCTASQDRLSDMQNAARQCVKNFSYEIIGHKIQQLLSEGT